MSWTTRLHFAVVGGLACFAALSLTLLASGQEPRRSRAKLREPVHRIAKARIEPKGNTPVDLHPLDPALRLARETLELIQTKVIDYSCILVKRERIKGRLLNSEYMFTEIRNRKVHNGQITTPFSVYMRFVKPDSVKGREVIYVEGRNKNKLVAHEGVGALQFVPPVWIQPNGPIAMRGQLYPITDVGIESLVLKLIEKGERDRRQGKCDVQFIKGAKINGRLCTVLQVTHPVPRPQLDFHIARIFIDDENKLPVRYAAYSWPEKEGGKPQLLEEYTYLNLKLNLNLTDEDFNHTKKFR